VAKRFEEFDNDGDGLITVAECRAAVDRLDRELSDGIVRESMWKDNYNKDGVVDYFQFIDFFVKDNAEEHAGCEHDSRVEFNSVDELLQHCMINDGTPTTRSLSRQAKAELIHSFKLMDTNKDGFLDKSELQVALRSMSPDLSAGQIDIIIGDIISKGDRNRDGLIDLYEFSSFAVQKGLYS
jgi:Ca2+-binding EF-hand superfamily protein